MTNEWNLKDERTVVFLFQMIWKVSVNFDLMICFDEKYFAIGVGGSDDESGFCFVRIKVCLVVILPNNNSKNNNNQYIRLYQFLEIFIKILRVLIC